MILNTFINTFLLLLHPFYVSITTIDYVENEKRIEISCRIFHDDLEESIKTRSNIKIDLANPTDKPAIDSLISSYLRTHLKLSVNDRSVTLRYVGYEIEDDVAWCYLEATAIPSVKRLTIDTRILYEKFPKQSNILHATSYGKRISTKLDNPAHQAIFEW